jgi:hypothetical protein
MTKAAPITLPKATVYAYFGADEKIGEQYFDFGNFNDFFIYKWCKSDGVYLGKIEKYANIVLKPGLKPTIRITFQEDYTNCTGPPGSWFHSSVVYGEISYYFKFRDIHPLARPGMTIRAIIEWDIDIDVNVEIVPLCSFEAKTAFLIGSVTFEEWIVNCDKPDPISSGYNLHHYYTADSYHDVKISAYLNILPTYSIYPGTASAKVYIDPTITIDPNYMINIDGKDYPANELFAVELSENLFEGQEAMPWIPLLLLDE